MDSAKIALVTGAGSGIGRAVVDAFDAAVWGVQGGTQQTVHIRVVIHNQDALRHCHPM